MLRNTLQLAALTIRRPGDGVRIVIRLLGDSVRMQVESLILVAIVGTLLMVAMDRLGPGAAGPGTMLLTTAPLFLTVIQVAAMALIAALMFGVGRVFGGRGGFSDCLSTVIWLQAILMLFQIAQLVTWFVLPFLSFLVTMAALMAAAYLFISFIKEVHGFRNVFAVIIGVIVTLFVVAGMLAMLLSVVGFQQQAPI